ncbi:CRAL TRIO domain containing protein [Asbolus verrucosus]|uniref:CRAL TRIO domain containing protein n=1 Tax=Asbolus verrucosus TaxID=1661398 RepID=A0A482WA75_ASBVE|nr:CRAL TRIO domain containing protein [Asbolus verrucosus]
MDAIQVTGDEIAKVRKHFKVKETDIKRDVKIIKDWIKQQQHLPKIEDENFIERCLLRNKFRIEQTKQKLDGYCTLRGRFAGCDFINAPPFINLLLSILKKIFPSKLYGRIRIHKDLKSFHKAIPKECLPHDYGGELDTVENLIAKWDKVFEHNQPVFAENLKIVSNENLRLGTNKPNEMFGVAGTFKQLNLD